MIKLLTRASIAAFIYANARIFTRILVLVISFICLNIFYSKWETLLLATNPDNLIYLLSGYSFIIFLLLIWVLISLPFFSSFSKSIKTLEVKKSIKNRSHDYEKIRNVRSHPVLKSSNKRKLED
jgi:hypothetical protein